MNYKPDHSKLFGSAIKNLLEEKNLSQRQFSKLAHLEASYVSKLVNGKIDEPRQVQRRQIAQGLDLTEQELQEYVDQYIKKHGKAEENLPISQGVFPQLEDKLNFVGREKAIEHLQERFKGGAKVIVIVAAAGIGKTTLAKRFLSQANLQILTHFVAKETPDITPVEIVITQWLRQYFQEPPDREFYLTLARLQQQLQNHPMGILIDNLETVLDENGKFIEPHRRYVELIRILGASSVQSLTLITSRYRLCESDLSFINYQLPELDLDAWRQYWQNYNMSIESSILAAMHKAYGGNAKVMDIIKGSIQEDFQGNMTAYWQIYQADILAKPDLKNLVTSQFDRLQKIHLNAYKLLCRLGCYRYQDVPRIPHQGLLCLLWDIPECERLRVIESLHNRCLVEFQQGEYWLHPMIRAEAILRLRDCGEAEITHRKAANFWFSHTSEVESRDDGIRVLEAIHQYCEIVDWDKILELLEKRVNLPIGHGKIREQLRYWGYSQEMINILSKLEGKLLNSLDEAQRLGTIGVSYSYLSQYRKSIEILQQAEKLFADHSPYYYAWTSHYIAKNYLRLANFSTAIKYFNQALEAAEKIPEEQKDRQGCKCRSLVGLGFLCHNKGEYQKGINYLQEALEIAEMNPQQYLKEKADVIAYLAECYFALGETHIAIDFKQQAIGILRTIKDHISEVYAQCYLCQFYLKMGEISLAEKALNDANALCEFMGLSDTLLKATLLQTQALFYFEAKGNKEQAINLYQESMQISTQIEAKYELVETSYQLALTYQKIGQKEESQFYFNQAIQLFTEMDAPKQVQRIEQSIKK